MKALFLTPQPPYPPDKGTSLRNFNLIKNMASSHEVHLLTFVEGGGDMATNNPLRSLCRSIHAVPAPPGRSAVQRLRSTLFQPMPDMALRLRSREFSEKLEGLLVREQFDVVQAEGIEMATYMNTVHPSRKGGHPLPAIIFDEHNAEYLLQRRAFETDINSAAKWPAAIYSLIQWQKLRFYERGGCRKATAVVAVSEADRKAILSLDPSLEVAVVSNGIDVEFLQAGNLSEGRLETDATSAAPLLVFVGTMDYRPNADAMVWFCRHIFPLVLRGMPAARLQIVGRSPARAVREAAGRNVDIVGGVDDVRPYIYGSAVYIVPMRIGGGVRFKVLEAMACGIPVVSTGVGAEGIDVVDGEHLLLAEEPTDFAAKVVCLLRDRKLAMSLAEKARRRVTSLYDWRLIAPRLEKVWRKHAGAGREVTGADANRN